MNPDTGNPDMTVAIVAFSAEKIGRFFDDGTIY
jgi:hypothetical protein